MLDRLGSGGMATVFLAEDERLGRKVAVKRLHSESPDDMAQRFQREAKLGASLNHPNLVSIFDTVSDDEGVLIIMEYVEGGTLAHALRDGPLETERALDVIEAIAEAIDHAHSAGVVHRDVKPANVLLGTNGTPKLVDLGIATAAEAAQITRSGTILGTPAYIAPERLEGGKGGPEVDVYSLACVAFEALSGRKARQGTSPIEIAHKVATEPPPDLAEVAPGTPKAAADVLKRAMARDPSERHGSAGEFARDLRKAYARREEGVTSATALLPDRPRPQAESAVAPAPRTEHRAPRAARRAPRLSGLLLVGLIALFLALAALAISALSGDDEPARNDSSAPQEQPRADDEEQTEEQAPADDGAPAEEQPAEEQPAEEQPAGGGVPAPSGENDPAKGQRLNAKGFDQLNRGQADKAVKTLTEAVAAWPAGTSDIEYQYALFNLGSALVAAGRPEEAIPVLEKRLEHPDQRETVQAKLDEAKAAAE